MKINPLRLSTLILAFTFIFTTASSHPTPGQFAGASLPPDFRADFSHNQKTRVEPELVEQLSQDESRGYLIFFQQKADLSPAYQMDWEQRGWFVMETLQAVAEASQNQVRAYLDREGADYQAFWIDNVIAVKRSNLATFNGLLAFGEIESLQAEPQAFLIESEMVPMSDNVLLGVESNIAHVQAPAAWDLGYTGAGITVGSIDTGVRYTHSALVNQYRGNLGGWVFDHNHNWWDPQLKNLSPEDTNGHGTHTVGIMVGDDGWVNQIGMAPGASWIACRGCTNSECTNEDLLACGQFMAAPWDLTGSNPNPDLRPHVVNNSWGNCDRVYHPWYQGVVDSWHAAGIYPVFANGNAGNCGYEKPPGLNTVGNPARYGNVTGVGSTGKNDGQYASHSAWGPTDNPDTVNPHGFPTIKPQVVAPGVGIRSSSIGSDSAYAYMTGTSMSTPHVAGLVALMWQAAPGLIGDYSTTETILQNTANHIPYATGNGDEGPGNVPNHATGWGEINALAAVSGSGYLLSDPRGLEVTLAMDTSLTIPLALKNLSSWDINFEILILDGGLTQDSHLEGDDRRSMMSGELSELPWIIVDPTSGAIAGLDTKIIQVTLDAATPEGIYQTTILVHNTTDDNLLEIEVSLFVVPEAHFFISLQPPTDSKTGYPGQLVTYSLTLTNNSNITDLITLIATDNSWPVQLSKDSFVMNPGEYSSFNVLVEVPTNSASGSDDGATITAISSSDGSYQVSAKLTTFSLLWQIYLPVMAR